MRPPQRPQSVDGTSILLSSVWQTRERNSSFPSDPLPLRLKPYLYLGGGVSFSRGPWHVGDVGRCLSTYTPHSFPPWPCECPHSDDAWTTHSAAR